MTPKRVLNTLYEEEKSMINTISKIKSFVSWQLGVTITLALLLVICAGYIPAQAAAKGVQHKTYVSPEEAVKSLVDAVKSDDAKALRAILGPESEKVISSGDDVADQEGRKKFVKAYEEKNKIEMVSDTKAMLSIGEKDWPLPIPIVKKGQKWSFDTKAAKVEISNRRIGRNELSTIQVCLAYVDAQMEYALKDNDGDGLFEYAQKFWSDPGKKNGLYWETKEGEDSSPFGLLVAEAAKAGYGKLKSSNQPSPYHGYYLKILKSQGKNAPGGAYDYVVKDNMIGGFALVAYPAQYGNSGVMTFIVNQAGAVYQKNLKKHTAKIAQAIKLFDPDKTWKKVESQ
jgi:hypothetical protein